jgi:deoxyribodipyrimidine photolyase-related protein
MSQFGDGGLLGSKPYISSGAYINRMSDYCQHCCYDVSKRVGENACPFNSLYWDFLARHRDKLGKNRRLAMPYRTWDGRSEEDQIAIRAKATEFLDGLDDGGAAY